MKEALSRIAAAKASRATTLDLGNCGLIELPEPLFELAWLKSLSLSGNIDFKDLSPLSALIQLQALECHTTQVSDLSPLSALTKLQMLDCSSTQVSDLSPLSALTKLQTLDCSSTQVSDLSPLSALTKLQKLWCFKTQVSDLSPIAVMIKLRNLDCSNTQVSDLLPLSVLTQMVRLNCSNTQVSNLSPLSTITYLQKLDCSNTQVSDLSPLSSINKLRILNCRSTQILDLLPLSRITGLKTLNCSDTQVSDLLPLSRISGLQILNCTETKVSDLSPLSALTKLNRLDCDSTRVNDLSPLSEMTKLQTLDCSYTKVSDLSPLKNLISKGLPVKWVYDVTKGIFIEDCLLSNPPIEIARQGNEAILRYWEEQERSGTFTLNEARLLIVGQAGSGKTSLRTKLMDEKADLPAEDKTTRGIDIQTLQFPTEAGQFNLRIWDFGGQNIQHYAHQFFLSDSVVYALVRDERKEDGGMNYWLNIISLLGKDSPVLIVQNLREGHGDDIKELAAIRKAFPKVQEPIKINLKQAGEEGYRPFRDLKEAICSHAKRLPHIGRAYAATYKRLQDDLQAAAQDKQFIRLEAYEAICQQRGMTNRDTMYDFLRSYHQLGVSLWFEHDLDLENYVFLKPKWIIDALFELLYDGGQRRNEAIIDTKTVKNIWRGEEYRGMHGILLKLMRNFEMCYEMTGVERYLIPQNQPPCDIELKESASATRVLFEYEFLPKGFLTRLICRQHHRILEPNVWNNAVIFGEKDGATVLAYETYDQNTIELIAEGSGKAQLLNETIRQLDAIHKDSKFKNLQVKKLVPCPCHDCKTKDKPYYFNYEYIAKLTLLGEKEERCQESLTKVRFKDILKEIQIFSAAQIRDYLAEDKIEEALQLLLGQLEEDHAVVEMMRQLKAINQEYLLEIISRTEYQSAKAKKVEYILGLLNGA